MRRSRFVFALALAVMLASLSAGAAFAGEITGNGELLEVKGASECAFSGQEDQQWFTNDAQEERKLVPTRGTPGHAQSWGQSKALWDFLISVGAHPGNACNPTAGEAHP